MITLSDENERIISWNKYAETLLGMGEEDLYMKPVSSLYPPEEWQKIRSEDVRQKGMQHHLETKMIRKNNELFNVDISLSVLKNCEGKVIGSIGIITDITKRKQMEKVLEESKEKFKQLYENAPVPYHTLLPNGKITNVNEKWCQIFRYSKEEVIERSIFDFIADNERDTAKSSFEKKIRSKKSYSRANERSYVTRDGEKRIFVIRDFFSFDEDNNVVSVHTTMEDVSKRKQDEEELERKNKELTVIQEQLDMLNSKLEEKVKERTAEVENLLKQKDEFIGQLSHDLRSPLTPLTALLPMIEEKEQDPQLKEELGLIHRNVKYLNALIDKTIELAKLNSPETKLSLETTNLLHEIKAVIENNKLVFEENELEILNRVDKRIIIKADNSMLGALFDNLISNAVKYSPHGGTITIDAQDDEEWVTVSIKDTGIGITREELNHIFEEFYKADWSRHDHESSGLGLSICKSIVKKHGGHIWAESLGKEKGTTMFFTIPSSSKEDMMNRGR